MGCLAAASLAVAPVATADAATDPLFGGQWGLIGASSVGAMGAWAHSTGREAVIAVLDTGVQVNHPDLAANIWRNPAEIPANGLDDDADGIVDDVNGANMADLSGDVRDDVGHGTCVAGIAAALKDNDAGGAGLAPRAKIMAVKVMDSARSGTTDGLARGIRYAVDRGARILNVSLAVGESSADIASAVRYAGARGAIIVAASGNDGRNIDLLPSYPASNSDPAVISVAAETRSGLLWAKSNRGLRSVDLVAPGSRITCTTPGSRYGSRSGTSVAAPFVSATLALMAAARPDLPMRALRDAILATARRTPALTALVGSGGRLDAAAAVHRALDRPAHRFTRGLRTLPCAARLVPARLAIGRAGLKRACGGRSGHE